MSKAHPHPREFEQRDGFNQKNDNDGPGPLSVGYKTIEFRDLNLLEKLLTFAIAVSG